MFENDLGEEALQEMEQSDITGARVSYAGGDYPCTMVVEGMGSIFIPGGQSPKAETTIYIRKAVLPDDVEFRPGHNLDATRNSTGGNKALTIAQDLGIRDLVFAYELTCVDRNENA